MDNWLDHAMRHWQLGESLLAGGAERWQRVIRQLQEAPVNLADILRARALL
jgi:hypothetical protein